MNLTNFDADNDEKELCESLNSRIIFGSFQKHCELLTSSVNRFNKFKINVISFSSDIVPTSMNGLFLLYLYFLFCFLFILAHIFSTRKKKFETDLIYKDKMIKSNFENTMMKKIFESLKNTLPFKFHFRF